jgi:hypothetical protein
MFSENQEDITNLRSQAVGRLSNPPVLQSPGGVLFCFILFSFLWGGILAFLPFFPSLSCMVLVLYGSRSVWRFFFCYRLRYDWHASFMEVAALRLGFSKGLPIKPHHQSSLEAVNTSHCWHTSGVIPQIR